MKEVAKILNVAVGEVFHIGEGAFTTAKYYQFTETGFLQSEDRVSWMSAKSVDLFRLLNGSCSVVKLPWKPKNGEVYFTPRMDSPSKYGTVRWVGNETDLYRYEHGQVYKSATTAIVARNKMLNAVEGEFCNG